MDMQTIIESGHAQQGRNCPAIPGDLGLWVARRDLLDMACEAAQTVPWPARKQVEDPDEIPIKTLRTLLVYSFSTGLYASGDIARSVPHDACMSLICADRVPAPETLRALRRTEQASLRLALAMVVRAVWNRRCQDSVGSPVIGIEAPAWVFQSDAMERLSRAVQAESASLED